jgi:transcriptional regulator with XRE-family HTH domain
MATRTAIVTEASRRAHARLEALVRDLRNARLMACLSQRSVGEAVGVSRALVGAWEAGRIVPTPIQLAQWGAVVGLDVSLRAFVGGSPLRDAGQLRLLERFRSIAGEAWSWRTEVPVGSDPNDRRAFDAVLLKDARRVAVEAIGRLVDAQAQVRAATLKQEAAGVDRLLLVLAETRHNRFALAVGQPTIVPAFPEPARTALAALRAGELPAANAVILV